MQLGVRPEIGSKTSTIYYNTKNSISSFGFDNSPYNSWTRNGDSIRKLINLSNDLTDLFPIERLFLLKKTFKYQIVYMYARILLCKNVQMSLQCRKEKGESKQNCELIEIYYHSFKRSCNLLENLLLPYAVKSSIS